MMQEVFEKLKTLQDILSEKYEIEREIEEIPKALNTKKELLTRLKKSYLEKNNVLEETKERLKHLKFLLDEAETQREGYEKQMDVISTQREYEALDKEIKTATERATQFRKDLIREEKERDDIIFSLEQEENMINEQEKELEEELEKIKEKSKEKELLLEELAKKEQDIIPGLDEEILFKFERIIKNKSGLGIVPVKDSVCTGCHMMLPAQFENNVRKGEDILFCPYCSRILYYEDEQSMEAFNDEDSGSLADLVGEDEIDFGD